MCKPHKNSLIVRSLYAGYQSRFVVSNVNLELFGGETIGLVGHNGSGKSTILFGIAGLINHKCKVLKLNGSNLLYLPAYKRIRAGIGILLQRSAVFPELDIKTNLKMAGYKDDTNDFFKNLKNTGPIIKNIVSRQMTKAGALSGGERRLLGFLMLLAMQPKILLCDEPTLGLSQEIENELVITLHQYSVEKKIGILLVSHNLRLIGRYCKRVYVLKNGNIAHEWKQDKSSEDLESSVRHL